MPDIFVSRSASRKNNPNLTGPAVEVSRRNKAFTALARVDPVFNRKTKNPFASFAVFPDGVEFETQQADEPVILLLRSHLFVNIPWILMTLLLLVAPLLFALVPLNIDIPDQYSIFLLILWYLLVLTYIFEKFLSWFFNIFIITDERVIDVDFYSLTYKQIGQAALGKIEEVNYKIGGVLRSVFDFGDILIETAGEQPNIEFEDVPHPSRVVSILNELITLEEQEMLDGNAR